MLRVLIVDDEPLARENLRVLLQEQPDIEVVGECGLFPSAGTSLLGHYRQLSHHRLLKHRRPGIHPARQ